MKIILTSNTVWNILHFRKPLIAALMAHGHQLIAVAPENALKHELTEMGVRFRPIQIDQKGMSPAGDLRLLLDFQRSFATEKPDLVLSFTVKNNIYGGIAAKRLDIPFLPNVSGLGTAFLSSKWLEYVATKLYRTAFTGLPKVFFQNEDDLQLFVKKRIVRTQQGTVLPGSGIDLNHFGQAPVLARSDDVTFLLIARLLRDKGVVEYVDAARHLKRTYPNCRFQLLGEAASANRTAISFDMVKAWQDEGIIEYLGTAKDVRPYIAAADCIVLPSYREGAPRTLLEGAAMGRPLIATDVPGCRDIVRDQHNGFLCKPREAEDLSRALAAMIDVGTTQRQFFGENGRRLVEQRFDEAIVVREYVNFVEGLHA